MPSSGIESLPLLEHPIGEYFEMPDGPDSESIELLASISDRATAAGAPTWYRTSFLGRDGVWLETVLPSVSGGGIEVDLLIRSWKPKNWRGGPEQRLWAVRLMAGLDCECWQNHGVHYVVDDLRECGSPIAMRHATDEILAVSVGWADENRDASWWYERSGLPSRP
jgi:hypothetical protein